MFYKINVIKKFPKWARSCRLVYKIKILPVNLAKIIVEELRTTASLLIRSLMF